MSAAILTGCVPRKALAWVNMGMGGLSLSPDLRDELGRNAPVFFYIGPVPIEVDAKAVLPAEKYDFAQQLGPIPVEAILPASVFRQFRVTLDYQARTLTLAPPSEKPENGLAVPLQVNSRTGIVSVDVEINW